MLDVQGGEAVWRSVKHRPDAQVLVVCGDADDRQSMQVALEAEGHAVEVAGNGAAALAMAAGEGHWDAVVVERRLGDVAGAELVQALRQRWPDLPALIIAEGWSAQADREARAAGEVQRCSVELVTTLRELVRLEVGYDVEPDKELWQAVCRCALTHHLMRRPEMPPLVLVIYQLNELELEVARSLAGIRHKRR